MLSPLVAISYLDRRRLRRDGSSNAIVTSSRPCCPPRTSFKGLTAEREGKYVSYYLELTIKSRALPGFLLEILFCLLYIRNRMH
jgi:hypothetical protein